MNGDEMRRDCNNPNQFAFRQTQNQKIKLSSPLTFPTANKSLLKQASLHSTMAWLILKKCTALCVVVPNERTNDDDDKNDRSDQRPSCARFGIGRPRSAGVIRGKKSVFCMK